MRRWAVILIGLLFYECSNHEIKKNELIRKLTGGKVKYWDWIVFKDTTNKFFSNYEVLNKDRIKTCNSFNVSGEHMTYEYDENGKRWKKDFGDLVYDNEWHYISDSTIEINGGIWKILKLSQDSLILNQNVRTEIYAKSKYQWDQ